MAASLSRVSVDGVGEVAQHGEVQVRVAVREVLHLEVLEGFVHRVHAVKQRRDHDRGAVFGRNAVLPQVELGQWRGGRKAVTS